MKPKFKKGDIVFYGVGTFNVNHATITCTVFSADKQRVEKLYKNKNGTTQYRLSSQTTDGRVVDENKLFTKDEALQKMVDWINNDDLQKLIKQNKENKNG